MIAHAPPIGNIVARMNHRVFGSGSVERNQFIMALSITPTTNPTITACNDLFMQILYHNGATKID